MDRKTTIAMLGILALVFAGLFVLTRPSSKVPPPELPVKEVTEVDADAGTDAQEPVGFIDESAEGRAVRVVREGEPVAGAGIVAGAPGSYPPELGETAEGGIFQVEHAATEAFDGDVQGWVELYGFEGEDALWTSVDLAEDATPDVELVQGHTIAIQVLRSSGAPLAGATVRLSREAVGLVVLEAVADEAGQAEFGPVPPGSYVVTAEAPGHLTTVAETVVEQGDAEVILELSPGVRVAGEVLDTDGRPVAEAVVAIYVDTGELQGVPREVVATDAQGRFEADRLPPGPTWALASGAGAAPGRSETIDTREGADRLTIRLTAAVALTARVVTENGEPVRGATVTWVDEATGVNGAASTNEEGRATFDAVVPGATLSASLRGWESLEHKVTSVDAAKEVELRLTRGEAPKRLRLTGLPADVSRIELLMATGTACGVDSIDERDFWVTGCPDGSATLTVVTESAGTATVRFALNDGATVQLPQRRPFVVQVTVSKPGVVPTADWSDGARWRRFDLQQTDEQVWEGTARLYPGRYMTRAEATGHAPEEATVELGAEGYEAKVRLEELVRHEVFVLDVRRATVTGARVEIYDGQRRVRVARSAGQLPVVVERPKGEGWYLVAIDPRRGEKRATLDAARLEVELTEPLGSVALPGRLTPAQLAARADLELVRDGDAWLFDPVRGTPAAEVLQRGDRYVTARPVGDEVEVVIERGRSEVTVRLPAN